MHVRFRGALAIAAFLLCFPAMAQAYRTAVVATDHPSVKASPESDSPPAETAPSKGAKINTSNFPTNGYYHFRSANQTGWINGKDLQFTSPPPAPQKEAEDSDMSEGSEEQGDFLHPKQKMYGWSLKFLAGFDFFNPSEVDQQIGTDSLKNGSGVGGEIDYEFLKPLCVAFRIEAISKSANGTVTKTGDEFNFQVSSMPIMLGGLIHQPIGKFSIDAGAYFGLGLSTQVRADDGNFNPPGNSTTISGTPKTYLLASNISYHFTRNTRALLEVGYRHLSLAESTPSTQGNGSYVFQNSSNQFVPIGVDLSGFVLNLGVGVDF